MHSKLTRFMEGTTDYTTCDGIRCNPSFTWPESALFQISASSVTLDKIVIGKTAYYPIECEQWVRDHDIACFLRS
jgi:hypothetical protein